jgi:hypothetical protein
MSYAGSIISSVGIAAGTGEEMYGDWYEGEQQRNYYRNQALITAQNKRIAEAEIAAKDQTAANQFQEAAYQRTEDDIKIANYRNQSEQLGAATYAKMGKSSMVLTGGTPLAYLSYLAGTRAKETANLSLQRDVNYWQGQTKAAITLDSVNLAKAQLPNYDYQSKLYTLAGEDARRAADRKLVNANIGALGKAGAAWGGAWSGMENSGTKNSYNMGGS